MTPRASFLAERVLHDTLPPRLIGHVMLGENIRPADKLAWLDFLGGSADACRRHRSHALFFGSSARWGEDLLSTIPPWAQLDGLLVHAQSSRYPDITRILSSGLQVVFFGRVSGVSVDTYDWVDFNYEEGLQRVCRFLCDLGHRHIALLQGDTAHPASRSALAGLERSSGKGMVLKLRQDLLGPRETAEAVKTLLQNEDSPTAIIWRGESLGADLAQVMQQLPEMSKLALVDVGNGHSPRPSEGVVAHLRGNMADGGRRSLELLLTAQTQNFGSRQMLLPMDLVLGRVSTA